MEELQGLHFTSKAWRDRAKHFGAIDDEVYDESVKPAIYTILNLHISGGSSPLLTKFGTVVELHRLHFTSKAWRDRAKHFGAIHDNVYDESAKIGSVSDFGDRSGIPGLRVK